VSEFAEELFQEGKVTQSGQLDQRPAVGNDQTGLPAPAPSLGLFKRLPVGFPVFRSVIHVRHPAHLQEFHELNAAQPKFTSGLAGWDLPVGKKCENGLLAETLLKLLLVDAAVRDIDLDLELHGVGLEVIVPPKPKARSSDGGAQPTTKRQSRNRSAQNRWSGGMTRADRRR